MSSVVYTHISGLSTNIVPIEIPSQEQHEGREEPEGFVEHGEYATTIHAVLLRVLDGGHMLELMALESGMRAARFSFASKIALQPALMMLGIAELHVLVVTLNGSIFRLRFVLPHLWNSTQYAPKEYRITSISAPIDGIVHVPEVGVVFIGLNDGGVLRLTAKMNGLEYTGVIAWPTKLFPSFSSLMPSFYSGPTAPDPSKIIALASIPPPLADSGYARATSLVATLSRTATCVWLTGNGKFVASKQIPSQFFQTDALITRSATPGKTPALEGHIIDSDYRPIIHMDAGTEVIVFMPTPGAETAGFFLLYRLSAQDRSSSRRDLNFVGRKPCSAQTEGWELRDFLVADDVLYLLWNSQGRTVIQTSTYDLDETEAEQEPWNTLSADEGDTLASSILAAILRPGAFSPYTLHIAIKQYEQSLIDVAPYILTHPTQLWRNVSQQLSAPASRLLRTRAPAPKCGIGIGQRSEEIGRDSWRAARPSNGRAATGLLVRDGSCCARTYGHHRRSRRAHVSALAGRREHIKQRILVRRGVVLRANIPSSELRQLEDALRSVSGDGRIAYSHDSVLRDVAQRHLDGLLPDGPAAFVRSGLGMIGDPEDAVLQALDVVGKLEHVVKLEDPDGGMGLAIGHDGEFKKALTTAYIAQSIEARYDLCLSILLLLLFIALQPHQIQRGGRPSMHNQSAGDLAGVSGGYGDVEDDVLARFEAMGFASPAPGAIGVGRIRHAFIREAGVLSDVALLDAGPGTLGLVERLRSLGYLDFSRELVMRLPLLPGPDEAAVLFEKVSNNFGLITHLTPNDQIALESVLPPPLNLESACAYYRHVAELFNDACCLTQAIPFWRQAIEDAPPDLDARGMWPTIPINLRILVSLDTMSRLSALSFKARHADPFAWPDYAKILYAWHVFRGDFRSAGAAMYERARRLGEEAVVEEDHSWVLLSVSTDEDLGRKRRKLTVHIPEAKFNPDCKDFEVVQLSDMRQEHALVSARIELLGYYRAQLSQYASRPRKTSSRSIRANNFDLAFSTGRLVGADLGPAFVNLATQCMNLTASAELADNESIPWLETDQTLAWDGSTIQRAWHYLQLSLERHDVEEGDWSYRKAVADTELTSLRDYNWLVSFFLEKQPDYLVRLCLKYNRLQDALLYSVRMVKEATDALSVMPPRHASTTCLPYSLFDQLIIAASEPASSSEQKHLAET
ncbi:nucleoporin [Rhizoctonia solani]|uniref:Nucleoporin n=1 Tax=Rhizoctonia solani TaxID=456999 RepID=A0A8H8NP23_9AGAM|nr:nucleoporin [Rhizoctonia solani]QRW15990.1 nucleoporin [Rhizoctonia solani]